jgi:hypothetical protein
MRHVFCYIAICAAVFTGPVFAQANPGAIVCPGDPPPDPKDSKDSKPSPHDVPTDTSAALACQWKAPKAVSDCLTALRLYTTYGAEPAVIKTLAEEAKDKLAEEQAAKEKAKAAASGEAIADKNSAEKRADKKSSKKPAPEKPADRSVVEGKKDEKPKSDGPLSPEDAASQALKKLVDSVPANEDLYRVANSQPDFVEKLAEANTLGTQTDNGARIFKAAEVLIDWIYTSRLGKQYLARVQGSIAQKDNLVAILQLLDALPTPADGKDETTKVYAANLETLRACYKMDSARLFKAVSDKIAGAKK